MRIISKILRDGYHSFENWRNYSNVRKEAHKLRKGVIDQKGYSFLDKNLLQRIKEYSHSTFGSSSYWPWLALYAELRDDFKEGWIPEDYYRFELISEINPEPMSSLSTIKSFDYRLFNELAVDPILTKISGSFFDDNLNIVDDQEALNLLRSFGKEMIVKIDGGPSGRGHIFIDSEDIKLSIFEDISDCVIQPVVGQHKCLNELYDQSVNTLRIGTFFSDSGTVEHKYTIVRFGKGGSRLDNIQSGGCFLILDINGNVISPAYNGKGIVVGDKHPDTGFEYEKLKVPSVRLAVEKCKESHLKFPNVKFIAWDIYIDENSSPGLIEWNAKSPGVWILEALEGPLFLNA